MFAFLLVLVGCRMTYWLFLFVRLALHRQATDETKVNLPLSLVVAVKNNTEGIQQLVQKIQKQNHENWEMVIVSDGENEGLKAFIADSAHPKIRLLISDGQGKKHAIAQGVAAAVNDWVLVTDSDCLPASLRYFDTMAASLKSPKTQIVLGYAPLRPKGSFISRLAGYEASYIAMQYLSYALAGIPYMGVGRNMLFDRALYLKNRQSLLDNGLLSGDDDMFVQAAANAENTAICTHSYTHCVSDAPQSLTTWFRQRQRQNTTASLYRLHHKILLGAFAALHLGVYFTMLLGLVIGQLSLGQIVAVWLMMIGLMSALQYPIFRKLNASGNLLLTPLADVFLAGFYTALAFKLNPQKQYPWK
ncbi:MAG: glycosyltransferase [Saprospiraceae bacterium]|nr:glycosyltransferase [Saprospiraceae bacterium]